MNKVIAKKSLGQNFLKNTKIISDICDAGEVSVRDTVLEIGPGTGALTIELLKRAGEVIAVEKDTELISLLSEKFSSEISSGKLKIINEDILENDVESLLINKKYKLIANIPYYITGAIIKKFLTAKNKPTLAVLLVQKEVAERAIAKDKKESILSVSIKAYGEPEYISTVKKGNFVPAPKVDSAILKIKNITDENFTDNKISEEKFFEFVHDIFGHKRKTIIAGLKISHPQLVAPILNYFEKEKIDIRIRAEDLDIRTIFQLITNC